MKLSYMHPFILESELELFLLVSHYVFLFKRKFRTFVY